MNVKVRDGYDIGRQKTRSIPGPAKVLTGLLSHLFLFDEIYSFRKLSRVTMNCYVEMTTKFISLRLDDPNLGASSSAPIFAHQSDNRLLHYSLASGSCSD
jgi:hypothetical protein